MKNLTLLRFGNSPMPAVSEVLSRHMVGQGVLMPIPGVVISVFDTETSIEVLTEELRSTDAYFYLVETNCEGLGMPDEFRDAVLQNFPHAFGDVQVPSNTEVDIEELLNKVRTQGDDSLTPEEKDRLTRYLSE